MTTQTQGPPRMPARRAVVIGWWLAFVLACAINLYGIYAPSQPGPAMFPGFDKVAHLGSFALVMATGMLARIRPVVLAVVLAAHAISSEIIQGTLLPDRSGDVWDVAADLAGIGLGWLVARLLLRRIGSRDEETR